MNEIGVVCYSKIESTLLVMETAAGVMARMRALFDE